MTPESTTTDFFPTRTYLWILYFLDPRDLQKKTHASNNNTMEDYECKVSNSHAILSYDYQQIGNISKTTSKFTSESGSRRFYLGNGSSFGGCFEMFFAFGLRGSELLMLLDRCCCITGQPLLSPLHYRLLPSLTDF